MKIRDFFKDKAWKKWDKSQWMILVLTGVLLMILAIPTGDRKKEEKPVDSTTEQGGGSTVTKEDYTRELEDRLAAVLSRVEGAGKVEVMITLEDLGESVVEKDAVQENTDMTEQDDTGGIRSQTSTKQEETSVYTEEESGKVPFVGKERTPKIAGILVVAQGGASTEVKQNISEAVMALFQIDVNRIKVVKMNIQEEEY